MIFDDPYSRQRSFGNEPMSSSKSAKLYLVSPYRRDMSIIRPHLWSGSDQMYGDIAGLMRARHDEYVSTMGGSIKNGFFLDRSHASHQAMMPSNEFCKFRAPILDRHGWQFMLVVNNEKMIGQRLFEGKGKKNRIIYSGFCIGDGPVIHKNGRDIVDESAQFYITHTTVIEANERINPNGYSSVANVVKDTDIISHTLLELNEEDHNCERDYILDPGEIAQSNIFMSDDIDGSASTVYSQSMASLRSRGDRPFEENSIMNSPKHHVNRVMSSLFQTMTDNDQAELMGGYRGDGCITGINDTYSNAQLFRSYVKNSRPDSVEGLDITAPYIEFREIINRYPNIVHDIEIFTLEAGIDEASYGFSEIEQAPNAYSILGALVKSSVPPIMQDCGISDCSFIWASSPMDRNSFSINRDPVLKVISLETIVPESNEVCRVRLHSVIKNLEKYVFSIVKDVAGEFEVYINYSSGKRTVVQLQLRDISDKINTNLIIGHNDLGGVISPMVGTERDYVSHTNTLNSILLITDQLAESQNSREFNIASENTGMFGIDNSYSRYDSYHDAFDTGPKVFSTVDTNPF